MTRITRLGWRHALIALAVPFLITVDVLSDDPEIALVIGEPFEDMRRRSSASIAPAFTGHSWFSIPKSDARLNFMDAHYGFVTPLARFFVVMYDEGLIGSVRMSPQTEPLLLDETLKIALDLQDQWRRTGWTLTRPGDFPAIADTPAWRERLRQRRTGITTYWQAEDRYQVVMDIGRFTDRRRPDEERYLISLAVSKPFVKPWEGYSAPVAP
ncbi:hypothetical protein RAM80_23975 [Pseudomonas sp. App30]|uniref:hypothetical protein n=1 Tax=Pseudomonas sp. App30 TaxID=3068990 RepID=UPI003A80A44F